MLSNSHSRHLCQEKKKTTHTRHLRQLLPLFPELEQE
jgi:hypothetical protein